MLEKFKIKFSLDTVAEIYFRIIYALITYELIIAWKFSNIFKRLLFSMFAFICMVAFI